jgi:Fe-Mn family superoxide dismutase
VKFEIPPLPYPKDALEPHLSAETLELHYERHHKGYLEKFRTSIEGKPEADRSLEDLIRTVDGGLFNNAAQVWNHTFHWMSLKPDGGGKPDDELLGVLESSFETYDRFHEQFAEAANGKFGSGWAWLVKDATGRLSVCSSSDAENPLRRNLTPLLTLDVWEHAYYVDYQNERARYVESFLDHLLNWDFVSSNLVLAPSPDAGRDVQEKGNREADRRYRERATAFAESGRIDPAARDQISR